MPAPRRIWHQWIGVALVLPVAVTCSPDSPPTYAEDVAPLLHRHCAACHRPDGPAPMPLLTYDDARQVTELIARATADRRMPPWLPARDAGIDFRDARILADREIEMLRRWADAGAPAGDLTRAPTPPPSAGPWTLGEPDLVLTMEESFPVPASAGHDLFRDFVLDVPLEEPRWVRAVELMPDNPRVVHHAIMKVDRTPTSRLADQADPLPGFDALMAESAARPPDGFFVGWTPGLVAMPFPEGMAWRLDPGTDFVVSAHLWPSGRAEEISLRIGLHFADAPPTRTPQLLRLGAQTIAIEPGDSAYVVEDRFRIPVDLQVIAAYPHAHFLARAVLAWAEPPDGGRIPLMDIPGWDFNRQEVYNYAEPVSLPAGTDLRMRYVYDNSATNPANPNNPPRRVLWGLNSDDEMAELWLQVITEGDREREELTRVAQQRDVVKQIEGWEHLAALDPDNPDVQIGLAEVAHARGKLEAALDHYDRAIGTRPGMTMAHHGRGRVLEDMGEIEAGMAAFQASLDALPTNLLALNDLGRLYLSLGDHGRALGLLQQAVSLDPTFADALNNLGSVLLEEQRPLQAAPHLERAVRLRPEFAGAHFNLAIALVSIGRAEDGLRALARGVELDGTQIQPAISVAWILATHPADSIRDPVAATDISLQVRQATGPHAVVSDVTAAAFAARADFVNARRFIDEAIEAAESAGDVERLPELRARRALYLDGRPYIASRSR
jgi:tetratricopeptide (TPR) repeat protein